MSIALVQTRVNTGEQDTLVYASPVQAGSTLILCVGDEAGQVPSSVSDTQGNTWVKSVSLDANRSASIWFATNVAAGSTTVTIAGGGAFIIGSEWCHSAEKLSEDDTASAESLGVGSHSCGSVTNIANNAIAITSSRVSNAFTLTVNASYTQLGKSNRLLAQYRVLTSIQSSAAAWISDTNEDVTSCQAVYGDLTPSSGKGNDKGLTRGLLL